MTFGLVFYNGQGVISQESLFQKGRILLTKYLSERIEGFMIELRDSQRRSESIVGIYVMIEKKLKQGKGMERSIKIVGYTLFPGR